MRTRCTCPKVPSTREEPVQVKMCWQKADSALFQSSKTPQCSSTAARHNSFKKLTLRWVIARASKPLPWDPSKKLSRRIWTTLSLFQSVQTTIRLPGQFNSSAIILSRQRAVQCLSIWVKMVTQDLCKNQTYSWELRAPSPRQSQFLATSLSKQRFANLT